MSTGDDDVTTDNRWHLRAPTSTRIGLNVIGPDSQHHVKGCPEIKVVIFDSGVDHKHRSLEGRIDMASARNFDHTLDEKGKAPNSSALTNTCIDNKYDAHGTALAGIVCAVEGHEECLGIAPECKVVPIRISSNFEIKSLISALNYASEVGDVLVLARSLPRTEDVRRESAFKEVAVSKAVSLESHGKETARPSQAWPGDEKKIEEALEQVAKKIPVICAGGNNGTSSPAYPATIAGMIVVGACNEKGYRATYSDFGDPVWIVAPSNDVPVEDEDIVRQTVEEAKLRADEAAIDQAREKREDPAAFVEQMQSSFERELKVDRLGELAIATTDNRGPFGYNVDPVSDYCLAKGNYPFGGTSAAAAEVAGVVALMLSAKRRQLKAAGRACDRDALRKALQPSSIRDLLRQSASLRYLHVERGTVEERDGQKWHPEFGFGLVDAKKAVDLAASETTETATVNRELARTSQS
jgi:subtilisin family serine protease